MSELRSLTAALTWQKRRLNELVEISGGPDPEHPLQAFSLRRIDWLEREIVKMKEAESIRRIDTFSRTQNREHEYYPSK